MPLTKGVGFINVSMFARERFGERGYAEVLSSLSDEDREALASVISVGWYDLALYARLIRALDRVRGKDDLSLLSDLGRYEAEHDFTTIHRVFLRFANPDYVVEKAFELWRRFHDTGTWIIVRESERRMLGTLEEWGVVDEALCKELTAYLQRLLELTGAKDVRVQHATCRAIGSGSCVFIGTWR
jgi:hypothetical protein